MNKAANILEAWSYHDKTKVTMLYTDVMKYKKAAYNSAEVAYFVNRHWRSVWRVISEGHIRPPMKIYPLVERSKSNGQYVWNEQDIFNLHDYLLSARVGTEGRRRQAKSLPSKMQIQALMRNDMTTYVADKDGNFIPVWKSPEWI